MFEADWSDGHGVDQKKQNSRILATGKRRPVFLEGFPERSLKIDEKLGCNVEEITYSMGFIANLMRSVNMALK